MNVYVDRTRSGRYAFRSRPQADLGVPQARLYPDRCSIVIPVAFHSPRSSAGLPISIMSDSSHKATRPTSVISTPDQCIHPQTHYSHHVSPISSTALPSPYPDPCNPFPQPYLPILRARGPMRAQRRNAESWPGWWFAPYVTALLLTFWSITTSPRAYKVE